MATRTYTVGDQAGVRRLDNLVGPWIDVSLNLLDATGQPINNILRDVMTDPNDENKVFVCGQRGADLGIPGIYWSSDAGVTWNKCIGDVANIVANATTEVTEIWCVDSNTIYATSDGGFVFKSTDGGITFNNTIANPGDVPVAPGWGSGSYEILSKSIHFVDANNGIVTMGIVGLPDYAFITTNGGTSWTAVDLGSFGFPSKGLGVHMSADLQTINVLSGTKIYRSTNGGANYGLVHSGRLLHLTWFDDNNLWATGVLGQRFYSNDAGATWSTVNPATPGEGSVKAAHFFALTAAYEGFFSDNGDIYSTPDGSLNKTLSEVAQFPGGIEAVWTSVPGPIDPPNPQPCGCPEGFTYNPATDECDQILSVLPICSPTILPVVKAGTNTQYGQMGTNFYASTVGSALPLTPISGVPWMPGPVGGGIEDANSIALPYVNVNASSNNFWGNCNNLNNPYNNPVGSGFPICTGASNVGRLNAVGVWASTGNPAPPLGEWIGFTTCVDVPTTGIYFIGIGSDESSRFSIDGVLFTNLAPGSFDEWSVWRVFPVLLTAGQHVIEMEGRNDSQFGGFGAEIYKVPNDDVNLLMAVTSEVELAPYIIWNTLEVVGGVFDLGEDSGCECPDGYALSNCDGVLECVQFNSVPFVPCGCYLLINCEDPLDTVLISTDPLDPPLDLTKIYVFDSIDPDKCWTVSDSTDCDPANPLPFSVFDDEFDTCEECLRTCYELIDCEDILSPIQTDTDLSAYVGQVIKITTCPETCWTVTELLACPIDVDSVTVDADFPDCVTCLPSDPPPAPLVIRNRTVKPGYNTPGCSPEYVGKISCEWSEALFQEAASKRYGIEFCCALDFEALNIKKELLNFKMITDPDACKALPCCPPCSTTALIQTFSPIACPAPRLVSAILVPPPAVVGKNCRDIRFSATGSDPAPQVFTGTTCSGAEIVVSLVPGAPGVVHCIDVGAPWIKDPLLSAIVLGPCS